MLLGCGHGIGGSSFASTIHCTHNIHCGRDIDAYHMHTSWYRLLLGHRYFVEDRYFVSERIRYCVGSTLRFRSILPRDIEFMALMISIIATLYLVLILNIVSMLAI